METSDSSSEHPNFSYLLCTKIFDDKAELFEHLDTCDGTKDFSAMILLSAIKKLRTILTTATSLMIPSVFFLSQYSKKRLKWFNLRYNYIEMSNVSFLSRNFYEYLEFCKTHSQSPLCRWKHFLCSLLCFLMHFC